jgi:hypothetical protein
MPVSKRVIDAAREFAAGTATIQDLAPEWDRELLQILATGNLTPQHDHRLSGPTGWHPDADTSDVGGVAALPPVATNAIAASAG